MAFTTEERSKIRGYLGFPDLYVSANPRLEGALDVAGADTDATTIVQELLVKLEAVETAIDTGALTVAGIKSVGAGDPEFYQGGKIRDLRSIGRGLCAKLSVKLGVQVVHDYFGTEGYGSDEWGNRPFQSGIFF